MFLLIRKDNKTMICPKCFTFHDVSINTIAYMKKKGSRYVFTFHDVSINTIKFSNMSIACSSFTFHDVSINTPSSIHPYNTDIILPLSVNLVTSLFLYLFLSFWTALIFEIFLISQALSTS